MALDDWKANGTGLNQEFLNHFDNLKAQQDAAWTKYKQELDNLLGINGRAKRAYQGTFNTNNPFANLNQMNEALKQKRAQTINKPKTTIDPAARRKEIERELDIIRGRIPTPKGYSVNPSRVKDLMLELKKLPK